MNWQTIAFLVCVGISAVCRIGIALIEGMEKKENEVSVVVNRQQRRHPDGKIPAQKFKRVSAKGRQKQGNGRAVKGW